MTSQKNHLRMERSFALFAFYWIALCAIAFVSALLNAFSPLFFSIYILGGVIAFFSLRAERFRQSLTPLFPFFIIIITATILWSFFVTPTVFTGRDQGSIATAAIFLADTHGLMTHTPVSDAFFSYYGEGRALNFPGFFYTEDGALTTQFPIPYIAWLAVFYSIFGIFGFTIANTILFTLFSLSFILLAQHITTLVTQRTKDISHARLYGLIFLLGSFPFMWFFGHTLSENLAQFLIIFMSLCALLFIKATAKDVHCHMPQLFFWLALFSGGLLIFTRIEGIVVVTLLFLAFLIHPNANDYLRTRMVSHLLIPALGILFALAFVFDKTTNFYKTIVKALLPSSSASTDAVAKSTSFLGETLSRFIEYLSYGILPFLILGFFGALVLWRKRKYLALLPLFITAPIFAYIVDPHISSDAPWMLRRMTFAILPLGMLYSIIAIIIFGRRSASVRIISISALILFMLPATITFFTFSENHNLLFQTQSLSENFTDRDLILVDAGVSGNNFSMIAGPMLSLFQKNAAYIFNPEDLIRINFDAFETIFLIIPHDNIGRYKAILDERLQQKSDITFVTTRLTQPSHSRPWDFPHRDTVTTQSTIFTLER